ncbi:MAG: hypothetical protein ACRDKG_02975 [Actinomycetota bacterium]
MRRQVWALTVLVSLLFQPVAGANPAAGDVTPQGQTGTSTGKRIVWTLIGAGIGFGAGLMFGLRQFDDAIDSDRKVWTSALVGAGAGGVAGAWLSGRGSPNPAIRRAPPLTAPHHSAIVAEPIEGRRSVDRRIVASVRDYNDAFLRHSRPAADHGRDEPRMLADRERDEPRMLAESQPDSLRNGIIAGAIVGGIVGLVVVPATECKSSNPECPNLLRIGVGIPAVAGGAAIGALVDKLFEE